MDFLSFRRRLRRGPALLAWMLCGVLVIGGMWANLHVLSRSVTWLQARSHVAVDGTLLDVRSYSARAGKRARQLLKVEYTYSVDGHQYQGSTVGLARGATTIDGATGIETYTRLSTALAGDKKVRVWVDPAHPHRSRLDRTLDWAEALGWTLLAFIAIVYGVVTGTQHGTLAHGTVINAQPRAWRALAFAALLGNLASWPLVLIALWEISYSGAWLILALLFAAICVAIALAAISEYLAEQRVGTPYVQYFQQGPATIRLRLHFRPPFGTRCSSAQFSGVVSVEVRQVMHAASGNPFSNSARIAWRRRVGAQVLARGTRFVDVVADLPDWPVTAGGMEPAYWEIELLALGTQTHFWLAPQL